jgi:hypothetical protein
MDEIGKIIKAAERQNWRVVRTTKGYVHFFTPEGEWAACHPNTPSSQRTLRNTIAKLRRHGLQWPPRT